MKVSQAIGAGSRTPLRTAAAIVAVVVTLWGTRLTILEGVVYPWTRQGFRGDFYAVMQPGSALWDGTGILYGPVFVVEKWIYDAIPFGAGINVFGLSGVLLLALTIVCCIAAVRASWLASLAAIGLALTFRFTFYALSVAASPELVELALLSLAWLAATRGRRAVSAAAVTFAALTKVIPALFVPLVLLRFSSRAFLAAAASAVLLLTVAAIGQRMGPVDVVTATLIPTLNSPGGSQPQANLIRPVPSSSQFVGLSSALARVLGTGDGDLSPSWIQTSCNVATLLLIAGGLIVAIALLRSTRLDQTTALALAYGGFFALLPLATFAAHPHTFVFLVPSWFALVGVLARDPRRIRAIITGALVALLYVPLGLPALLQIPDRLFHLGLFTSAFANDPIWPTVLLVLLIFSYSVVRLGTACEVNARQLGVAAHRSVPVAM